jgi:hypothetical protein
MNFNDTIIALHAEIKGRDEVISMQEDQLETQAADIAKLNKIVGRLRGRQDSLFFWSGVQSE